MSDLQTETLFSKRKKTQTNQTSTSQHYWK